VINFEEARATAEQTIGAVPDNRVIVEQEVPNGWTFFLEGREYVETGDAEASVVGGWTWFVRRSDGVIEKFGGMGGQHEALQRAAGLPDALIDASELAQLLRESGHPAAAAAAEASDTELELTETRRVTLSGFYRVRKQIQAEAGRLGMVDQIDRFLQALAEQPGDMIFGCSLSDREHCHLVFLSGRVDAVIAVLVPPGPAGRVDDYFS